MRSSGPVRIYPDVTAAQLAALAHLPPETVAPVLHRLAFEKRIIFSYGLTNAKKYRMLALVPEVFELCMAWSKIMIHLLVAAYRL